MYKFIYCLSAFLWVCLVTNAQSQNRVTLPEVQQWAANHFPQNGKKQWDSLATNYQIGNLQKNFLPQISMSAQASWQNQVTKFPLKLPPPSPQIEPLSLDQYRLSVDLSQLLYDGGVTKVQQQLLQLQHQGRNLEIEQLLQPLYEKVNTLYFNVLAINQQLNLLASSMADIETGIAKVGAQVKNGIALRSNLASLEVEKMRLQQRHSELIVENVGIKEQLGLLTGMAIDSSTIFELPELKPLAANDQRTERQWFQLQDSSLQVQKVLTQAKTKPRLAAFMNGGYGRPGFNMLENSFQPFVMAGLRANWNISALYHSKNDQKIIEAQQQQIQIMESDFDQRLQSLLIQQKTQINRMQALLKSDLQIISKREQIKKAAKAQLENGIINAADYIREVSAEDQARQTYLIHQLQLIQASIQYQTISGIPL